MITLHSNFKDKQSTFLYSIQKECSAHDFNVKDDEDDKDYELHVLFHKLMNMLRIMGAKS